jgi:hypothetical protein
LIFRGYAVRSLARFLDVNKRADGAVAILAFLAFADTQHAGQRIELAARRELDRLAISDNDFITRTVSLLSSMMSRALVGRKPTSGMR